MDINKSCHSIIIDKIVDKRNIDKNEWILLDIPYISFHCMIAYRMIKINTIKRLLIFLNE